MLHPTTVAQFQKLSLKYPAATIEPLPSGAALVTIPEFELPDGWSAASTLIRFLVPVGYPGPQPDCFWASSGLRLADGGLPKASQDPNIVPETQISALWFSWHVTQGWHPARDDLTTWVSMISGRFDKPQ